MTALRQLTAEEIDALPAGREMDALVAECISIEGVKIETGPAFYGPMWKYNGGYREEFRPSTDIAAAWQVVDKIESLHLTHANENWEWGANFCEYPESKSSGKTAPLAICRAALKAVID